MKSKLICFTFCLLFLGFTKVQAQSEVPEIVDVVWLKGGSKLSGTILKWELSRGMEFKLVTGAEIIIPRQEIVRVFQDIPMSSQLEANQISYVREIKPYAFKEEGLYHSFSGFLNFSFMGGAGLNYSIGHRFNRLLGVGIGTGIETHDFNARRNFIPVYAEARGFFVESKISPYYALKAGYGFATRDEIGGTLEAHGGFHFSPELGVRFGGRAVNYFLGVEYKIQNASFVEPLWSWDGQGIFTDKISYRRLEMRTGLVF